MFHIIQTLILIAFRQPLFPYYLLNHFFLTHVQVRICFTSSSRLDFELPLIKCLSYPPWALILRQQEWWGLALFQVSSEVITLESELLIMEVFDT